MWDVTLTKSAYKQLKKLPLKVQSTLHILVQDLQKNGPFPGKDWPNYGKLMENERHCHLIKGKPTYVSCWRVIDKKLCTMELYYVGTHENAPY